MGLKPDQAVFDDLIKQLSARLDAYEVVLSKQKYFAGNVRYLLLFLSLFIKNICTMECNNHDS
jgi:glutathionyl-hydroquinone reductase